MIILTMMLSLVACCGGNEDIYEESTQNTTGVNSTEKDNDEVETTSKDTLSDITGGISTEATITPTVLFDNSWVKITAKYINYTKTTVGVAVEIENKHSANLNLVCGDATSDATNVVNGYMIRDCYMNAYLEPKSKILETIEFSVDELKMYGITEIADIQLHFAVFTDRMEGFSDYAPIIKTSIYEKAHTEKDTYLENIKNGTLEEKYGFKVHNFDMKESFNANGVKIVSQLYATDNHGKKNIYVEVFNSSDKTYRINIEDIFLNGLKIEGIEPGVVRPGCYAVLEVKMGCVDEKIYKEYLGISEVGTVKYRFEVAEGTLLDVKASKDILYVVSEKVPPFAPTGQEVFNQSDIQIIAKGIMPSDTNSKNAKLIFLVRNDRDDSIYIDMIEDSLKINGHTASGVLVEKTVDAGNYMVIEITAYLSSLKKHGITSASDVTDISLQFKLLDDDRDVIAKPLVTYKKEQ
jgi:hypothetical protein